MGDLKLVLAGCVASQEGAALLRRIPELDLVMGPHHANRCACPISANLWLFLCKLLTHQDIDFAIQAKLATQLRSAEPCEGLCMHAA